MSALIDVIREEGLVEKAAEDGQDFRSRLKELALKHSVVADVRGQGLMLGMEICVDSGNNDEAYNLGMLITALCERRRVHLTYTYFEPVLRFLPPLTITREQIDRAVCVLDEAICEALRKDVSLNDLLPRNPYTRSFAQKSSGKTNLKRTFTRLYETSPQYWVKKIGEMVGK